MAGVFLTLEGVDGAGKSSQLQFLAEFFRRGGKKVRTVHFPRLDARPYGAMVAAYLRGEYGSLDSVSPRLAALLYALDRLQAGPELRAWLQAGEVVIADRYVHSNIAYQCAKMDDPPAREALARWIAELEYIHHNIPRPDLSLFLDAPLGFALRVLADERKGADGGRDIHEANAAFQERVRDEFIRFADSHRTELAVVSCAGVDGGMADAAAVSSRVVDALRYYGITTR